MKIARVAIRCDGFSLEGDKAMIGTGRARVLVIGFVLALIVLAAPQPVLAQTAKGRSATGALSGQSQLPVIEPSKPAADPSVAGDRTIQAQTAPARPGIDRGAVLRLLSHANPILWPLAVCSVITLGYVLERLMALRRDRVVPREFVERFLERLSSGKLDRERAIELCRAHDCTAARVFALVVNTWGQPGATIRQTIAYDSAGEIVDLKRNLRVLSAMATLGPLLGLLGTVVGIIQSFDALGGRVGPARGEVLAQGISLALVATAFGLTIAIIAVAFYYYFQGRIDVLVRELDDRTRQVIELVSSESQRHMLAERRHSPIGPPDFQRQESRAI
jgi:biopolymer transport protein ExbB